MPEGHRQKRTNEGLVQALETPPALKLLQLLYQRSLSRKYIRLSEQPTQLCTGDPIFIFSLAVFGKFLISLTF